MKKIFFFIGMLGAFSILSLNVNAQDDETATHSLNMGIPEVTLLTGTSSLIDLELTTTVAGTAISGGIGTGYIQISSIILATPRTITASVAGVPAGTALAVTTVVPVNANQAGVVGTGTAGVSLVNNAGAATLVTGIGSCYTGTGLEDGYQLNYSWNAGASGDYGSIVATAGVTALVTLTITGE